MKILADRMKELRIDKGLTQIDVANMLQVSRVVYNRYENNKRDIPVELIVKISKFYNVSADYLLGLID